MRCSIRWIFLLLAAMLLLSGCADALDVSTAQKQLTDAVPQESQELLNGVNAEMDAGLAAQLKRMLKNGADDLRAGWTAGLHSLARVAVIALLCGAADGMRRASGADDGLPAVSMAGVLAIAAAVLFDMSSLMALCRSTLESVSAFSKTMVPVMAAAVSLSGAPTRAAVMQAATMFALELMIRMINSVLLPVLCVYLAIMTVNYAMGQQLLQKLGEFLLWFVRTVLKAALTLFVTYLTLSGVLSGSADELTVKTAKAALSGSIPVVGGVISDATESLLAGAVVLRGLTGVFGILCVIAICLVPFFKLGINYLLFKGGAALLSMICGKELTGYLSALSEGFGVLLGMLGTCAAILFFEIVFSVNLLGG